jgi:exopolysaccharide production protein ExoY
MSATCLASPRPIIRPRELPRWLAVMFTVEQVAAGVLLILLAPIFGALAVLIWAISRRPPLVAHLRVGQYGQPLWVLKYRTMWNDGARFRRRDLRLVEYITESGCPLKVVRDPRVTSRFAQFCRRHSIDELPQLIHIARGEMSLVGPRPITAVELAEHYGPHAAEILSARPGLTGLWQSMGRNRLSYRQRLRLDQFLVRHCCVRLYLRVVLRTIPRVLTGKDAW